MSIERQGNFFTIYFSGFVFKTSSLKLLDQSKPNFCVESLGKGEKKIYINGPGYMTKMATIPLYGNNKTFKKSSFLEPEVL